MNMQKSQLKKTIIAVLLTLFVSVSVSANGFQSHSGITHAVKEFVLQQRVPLKNIQVRVTSLNKQLRLPQCGQSLQVSMAPGAKLMGNSSLSVSCAAPQQWKIHVAAHIDGEVDALVARYPIPRGTQIRQEDLEFVLRRYSQLNHGYYNSAKMLENKEAKRNIRAGQVLTPNLVKAQKLVLRGQHITIVAQNGGLNLRVKGKALMDGQQGQTIKVRNLNSKKLIYARVISAGMVKVNF
jgi:flagella basal body P-ring formation protein FlgA